MFQQITDKVVKQLEQGCVPWRKNWRSVIYGRPANFFSKRCYTGMNALLLNSYEVPYFGSYRQWYRTGRHILNDNPITVYFWKLLFFDELGNQVYSSKQATRRIPYMQATLVWNVLDIEGYDTDMFRPKDRPEDLCHIEECQRILELNVHSTGHGDCAYVPSTDKVLMPRMGDCDSPEEYYFNYFHELAHWTGAAHRLDRLGSTRFGTDEYAFEELVAQIAAMFVATHCGLIVDDIRQNDVNYINGWLQRLKGDNTFIFRAARQAEVAAEWLINGGPLKVEEETETFTNTNT